MVKNDQRRLFQAVFLTAFFTATVFGAWAWYHVDPKRFPVSYTFKAAEQIQGYEFKPQPLGEEVVQILATTNLLNGEFRNGDGRRFTVFMGTWDAARSKELAVVAHTPDICWAGGGAVPVSVGQPDHVELDLGLAKVPFAVRLFQMSPTSKQLELTVWCTLISGQVFAENERFGSARSSETSSETSSESRRVAAGRRLAKMQLVRAIRDRVPGDGSKQFVRFSTPLDGDWKPALEQVERFAQRWLQLRVSRDGATTP